MRNYNQFSIKPTFEGYYLDNNIHRLDGPAIMNYSDNYTPYSYEWYLDGMRHRENGPAIEWRSGTETWYFHGKLHRESGPAHHSCKVKVWYNHGFIHRVDGPATEYNDGTKEWYLDGEVLPVKNQEEYEKYMKTRILK